MSYPKIIKEAAHVRRLILTITLPPDGYLSVDIILIIYLSER